MSTHRRHDLRKQNQPNPNPEPDDPVKPDIPDTPEINPILPQIVYYKNYTLNTDGLDNISIIFDSEEDKIKFDLALLNRIWNKNETSLDYYSSHGFKWLYGTNKDNELTNVNVLIGITSLEQDGQSTRMYLFIYSFSQITVRGILRIHQIILPVWTNYALNSSGDVIQYGVYSMNKQNNPETPLLGFYKVRDEQSFYLPRYSFFLQGKHQDIISSLLNGFNGKFNIDFPSIKA